MFKILLILVSLIFSLSLTKESNTSSCYYRLSGSSMLNVDSTFNYLDADNKSQSVHLVYGDMKLLPYVNWSTLLDGSISLRGQIYRLSSNGTNSTIDAVPGEKLLRVSLYTKSGLTTDCPTTYTIYDPMHERNVVKTCTTSLNKLYYLIGIVPGTTVSVIYGGRTYVSDPLTIEGAVLSLKGSGITQTAAAYFYLKNTTTQSQTVSYTAITGRDTSIVCPANSVTEVTYGANNTSVWIGSVKYDGVQLGDKIVIGSGDAVEKSQLNIHSNSLTVYPNPCTGIANIQMATKGDVTIFTLDGKLVQSYKNVNSIRTEPLSNGVYIVSTKLRNVEQRRMITVVR